MQYVQIILTILFTGAITILVYFSVIAGGLLSQPAIPIIKPLLTRAVLTVRRVHVVGTAGMKMTPSISSSAHSAAIPRSAID